VNADHFVHHGKVGDAIFSLYVVKKAGGGKFTILDNDFYNHQWGERGASQLQPFIEYQNYIDSCDIQRSAPVDSNYCFLRASYGGHGDPGATHIVQKHVEAYNLWPTFEGVVPNHDVEEPWLTAPEKSGLPAIVCQIPNIRGERSFKSWRKILEGRDYLIYERKEDWGKLQPYFPSDRIVEADTVLDIATHVASSKVFIGCNSSVWAIADGMKRPALVDVGRGAHNSLPLYRESENIHSWSDDKVIGRLDEILDQK